MRKKLGNNIFERNEIINNLELSHRFTFLADKKREYNLRKDAVNIISSERRILLLNFLRFIKAENRVSLMGLADVLNGKEINFVSACCFHRKENYSGLVDQLSAKIIELMGKTIALIFNGTLVKINWHILTFGPGDWDLMCEYDLKEIVLPYILGIDSREIRENEFKTQWDLTQSLINNLVSHLMGCQIKNISITLHSLKALFSGVDSTWLLSEAENRAEIMFKKLSKNPPAIFSLFKSEKEKILRCKKEAIVYLATTKHYVSMKAAYIGLEVHGGYLRAGNLNRINDDFLPLFWFYPALCQHWGLWAEKIKSNDLQNYEDFLKRQ